MTLIWGFPLDYFTQSLDLNAEYEACNATFAKFLKWLQQTRDQDSSTAVIGLRYSIDEGETR